MRDKDESKSENKIGDKSIEELVQAVKAGDSSAFEALEERYRGMMTAQASSFGSSISALDRGSGSSLSADDLLQEAEIAFLRAARTYDPEGKSGVTFGLYAKICVRNALISLFRKDKAKMNRLRRAGGKKAIAPVSSASFDDRAGYEALLKSAKKELSAFEFAVFEAQAGGMTPADTAKAIGRPVKSVYNALHRIKAKIRKMKE